MSTHKLLPFDSICKVLGVQLDLKQSGDSLCLISNTPERVEELAQEINLVLSSGSLPKSEGEKLRGRLQFASAQVFGRKFRRLLKILSNHVTMGRRILTAATKCCLEEIVTLLTCNVPRKVVATQADILHVYVDASSNEVGYSGIGGLVIDMLGTHLSFFSAEVEGDMIRSIVTRGQRTIIQELEMLAVLCAFKCWQKESAVHRVVLFTDTNQCVEPFSRIGPQTVTVMNFSSRSFKSSPRSIFRFGLRECQVRVTLQTYFQGKWSPSLVMLQRLKLTRGKCGMRQLSSCEVFTFPEPFTGEEARLWQSEVTANSPLSKRERCFACLFEFQNSTLFTHGS